MTDAIVYVVDDDGDVRESVGVLLGSAGFTVEEFTSAKAFLAAYVERPNCCLVSDIRMPEMDGLELQAALAGRKAGIPVIFMTGHGDVPLAVRAMKGGATDFLEKPFDDERLIASVRRALAGSRVGGEVMAGAGEAAARLSLLTGREREVLLLLSSGHANKVVAHKLDISPRTVEVHRANLMRKLEARNLADLVRLAVAAGLSPEK